MKQEARSPKFHSCSLLPASRFSSELLFQEPLVKYAISKQAAHVVVLGDEAYHQGFDANMAVLRHTGECAGQGLRDTNREFYTL